MSYLVLARKYRPQTFDEVVGQSHITRILKNSLNSRKIAHAYLFAGPRGVGKTSMARILAKALNCEKGITSIPCNQCVHCREISEGRSVDVLEIDGASNRTIDEARDIREKINYSPANSRFKIYIIDEVHMLTTYAFNALLKTLEEPPDNVVFILATTEPNKLPSTIISRCQRFDFRKLSTNEIFTQLKKIAEEESMKIEDNALKSIAYRADGALRDAEGMLDQMISYAEGEISVDNVIEIFGFVKDEIYGALLEKIVMGDEKGIIEDVENIVEKGYNFEEFTIGFISFLKSALLYVVGISDEDFPEREGLFKGMIQSVSTDEILAMISIAENIERNLKNISYPKAFLIVELLKMSKIPDIKKINEIINAEVRIPKESQETQRIVSDKVKTKEEYVEEISKEETTENKLWDNLIKNIPPTKKRVKALAHSITLIKVEDNKILVSIPETQAEYFNKVKDIFIEALNKITGKTIDIEVKSKNKRIGVQKMKSEVDNELIEHPITQHFLRVFQAKIKE